MKKELHDMSHYAECSTLMLKFRNNHKTRLIITIILLIFNFYGQTVVYATKYAGPSMEAVIYENDGKSVSIEGGILALSYMGLFIGGWAAMFRHKVRPKVLVVYTIVNLLVMAGFTIYNNVQSAHDVQGAGAGLSHLAFGYGILTLFFSVACIILAFLGEQTKPRFYIALLIVLLLATLAGCYYWAVAAVLLAMYFFAIPEYKKMQWIVQQPGYPYFNERFDEAQAHSEYEPMHKLDNRSYGEMADVDGNMPDAASFHAQEQSHQEKRREAAEPQMEYTLKVSDDPAEMPGIDDIFEHTEPQPDPEPNWDVPDVLSDIPDLPKVPDLPKLPDIPKL